MKNPEEKLKTLKEMRDIQGDHGNWDFDPYMHGLYNALEFSVSIFEEREPVYREKPETWLSDKPLLFGPPKSSN